MVGVQVLIFTNAPAQFSEGFPQGYLKEPERIGIFRDLSWIFLQQLGDQVTYSF